jgi:hypothetical protein
MIKIEYPDYAHQIREQDKGPVILDPVRRKWVSLTPEEWVRQNFLQFLLQVMGYPSALFSIEKEFILGELHKRYDIVVYDRHTQPWLLVECKQTTEPLDELVLNQALRYHIQIRARYIVITNGHYTYAWENEEGRLNMLTALPSYDG